MEMIPADKCDDFQDNVMFEDFSTLSNFGEWVGMLGPYLHAGASATPVAVTQTDSVSVATTGETFPIAGGQTIYLFLPQAASLCMSVTWEGKLDAGVATQAWKELLTRHLIMRSRFVPPAGAGTLAGITMEVVASPDVQFTVKDLRSKPASERKAAVDAEYAHWLNIVWDVYKAWPLHQFYAVRLEDELYEVFFVNHHSICDGLAVRNMIGEFTELYHVALTGSPSRLPPVTAADYKSAVSTLNALPAPAGLRGVEPKAGRTWWNPDNSGFSTVSIFKNEVFGLTKQQTSLAKKTSKQLKCSLYSLCLGAFLRTFAKLEPSWDSMCIQVPTGGRVYPGVDASDLAGSMAQGLNVCLDMPRAGESWTELVARINAAIQQGLRADDDLRDAMDFNAAILKTPIVKGKVGDFSRTAFGAQKSNLYMPYTGSSLVRPSSQDSKITAQRVGTRNGVGTIDMFHEAYNGALGIYVNYDSTFFKSASIQKLMSTYVGEILAASGSTSGLAGGARSVDGSAGGGAGGSGGSSSGDSAAKAFDSSSSTTCDDVLDLAADALRIEILPEDLTADLDEDLSVDSLQRVRLIGKMQEKYGTHLRDLLFACSTLMEMALVIDPNATASGATASSAGTSPASFHEVQGAPPTSLYVGIEGAAEALQLPTDTRRLAVQTYSKGSARLTVWGLPALEAGCSRIGVTLEGGLLAVFTVLLHRWSRQDEIVVGVAAPSGAVQGLVTGIPEGVTAGELCAKVQKSLGEYDSRAILPLINAAFGLGSGKRLGITTDVSLFCEASGTSLQMEMEYNADLFDHESITGALRNMEVLLGSTLAEDSRTVEVTKLKLLGDAERSLILSAQYRGDVAKYTGPETFKDMFESIVARTPNRIALESHGQQLTYAEYDKRANRIAHCLRTKYGVKPGVAVGLSAERTLSTMVCMMGIAKAGGGYVSFDTHWPSDRLTFISKDASLPVTLCGAAQRARFAGAEVQTLVVDDADWGMTAFSRFPDTQLPSEGNGQNLGYMIYTSGSTGTPKGVLVHQGGVLLYADEVVRLVGWSNEDRVLQQTTMTFDVHAREVWGCCRAGATLVLVSEMERLNDFAGTIRNNEISILCITPSHLSLVDAAAPFPHLKHVTVSGEAAPLELIKAWTSHPPRKFWNLYGPTECCVDVTMIQGANDMRFPTSIGRPLPYAQVYIVDKHLQVVPTGHPGELLIGGPQVAIGYLNRPEKTAAAFIPDHLSGTPGARLYRTGDLVRWLPDHGVEFLGRIDFQVKLRGYRIELGEIEACLRRTSAALTGSIVLKREEEAGSPYLAAYYVTDGSEGDEGDLKAELKAACKRELPVYMVPSAFVHLGREFPLNSSRKIDRGQLPVPQKRGAGRKQRGKEPGDTPRKLQKVRLAVCIQHWCSFRWPFLFVCVSCFVVRLCKLRFSCCRLPKPLRRRLYLSLARHFRCFALTVLAVLVDMRFPLSMTHKINKSLCRAWNWALGKSGSLQLSSPPTPSAAGATGPRPS
jgi:amino acid adenylation domain-containing protein